MPPSGLSLRQVSTSSLPDPTTMRRVVLDYVGLDSRDTAELLRIFVDGVFNNAWRSGPIEDVHASKWGPSDGQMFRMNTFLIHGLQDATTSWIVDNRVSVVDRVSLEMFTNLIDRYRSLLLGERVLVTPTQTIAAITRKHAHDIRNYADESLYGLLAVAEEATPAVAIYARILEGTMFRGDWGAPGWEALVDRFVRALDEPDDEMWRFGSREVRLARLAGVDRSRLSDLLKHRPWGLTEDEADGVIEAGIGFLRRS